jgi:hypothetical protein
MWALEMAARPGGLLVHGKETAEFLMGLEREGLLRQSNNYPIWWITDAGRAFLNERH